MKDFFAVDLNRFSKFSVRFEDILIDYSKNIISEETMNLLLQLAREVQLENVIEKMLSGDVINETENRARCIRRYGIVPIIRFMLMVKTLCRMLIKFLNR